MKLLYGMEITSQDLYMPCKSNANHMQKYVVTNLPNPMLCSIHDIQKKNI